MKSKKTGATKTKSSLVAIVAAMSYTMLPVAYAAPPPPSVTPTQVIDASTYNGDAINVSSGQIVVVDFSNGSSLNLGNNNLSNSGSIYLVSSNNQVNTGTISALNISNLQNSLFTSVLPSGGINGFNHLLSNFSFTLQAAQNIINNGTLSSAGNMSLIASSITNTGANAVMQAIGNLNIDTASLVNSATIASIANNINITSNIANNIIVNNLGGTMQALQGIINVRDSLFNGNYGFSLSGGNILAKELNIFSGTGAINLNVNSLSPTVNVNAGTANIICADSNLKLGSINLSGDPTFANTAGNVLISSSINVADNLAILASGNIQTTAKNISITSGGGNILMIAGANLTSSGSEVTVNGASATGGSIILNGNKTAITQLSSSPTTANTAGGDITLISYAGSGGGQILMPTSVTITSSGTGTGANGNVMLLAGAPSGESILVGGILAGTNTNSGGNISIYTAQAQITGSSGCLACAKITDGKVTNGALFGPSTLTNSSFSTLSLEGSGNIDAQAGNALAINGNIESHNGSINLLANGGDLVVDDALRITAWKDISLTAEGDITLNKTSNDSSKNLIIQAGYTTATNLTTPGNIVNDITQTLDPSDIVSVGNIYFTSRSGNINFNRGINTTAVGDIVLSCAGQLNIESSNVMNALGGYIALSAGEQVQIHKNSTLFSVAKYTNGTNYYGGGVGIVTESPGFDLIGALQDIQQNISSLAPGTINAHLIQNPNFYWDPVAGGYIGIHESKNDPVNITGGSYEVYGGVISIETPGGSKSSEKIDIDNSRIVAIAPGGTTGGTTTGGETTGGTTTGGTTTGGTTTGGETTGGTTTGGTTTGGTTTGGETTGGTTTGGTTTGGTTTGGETTGGTTTGGTTTGGETTGGETTGGTTTGGETTGGETTGGTTTGGETTGGETTGGTTTGGETTGGTTTGGETTGGETTGGTTTGGETTGGTTTGGETTGGETTGGTTTGGTQSLLNIPTIFSSLPPTDLTPFHIGPFINPQECSPVRLAENPFAAGGSGEGSGGGSGEAGYMVAIDPETPYGFENDDDTLIVAGAHTKFKGAGKHTIALKEGNLTIITGDQPAFVQTSMGTLQIPPHSSISVNQGRFGGVQICNLDGQTSNLSLAFRGQSAQIAVANKHEVTVQNSAIASSGVSDFALDSHGNASSPVPGVSMTDSAMAGGSAGALKNLSNCRSGCLTVGMKKNLNQLLGNFANSGKQFGAMLPEENSFRFRPVSYDSKTLGTDGTNLSDVMTLGTDSMVIKHSLNSKVKVSANGTPELIQGELVAKALKNTVIKTGDAEIALKRGAIVLVSLTDGTLKVCTLSDTFSDSVQLKVTGNYLSIAVGHETVLSSSESKAMTEMSKDSLGRRRMHITELKKSGRTLATSEVSPAGLLHNSKVLKSMYKSTNRVDRQIIAAVVKMSACLQHVTSSHGSYKQIAQR